MTDRLPCSIYVGSRVLRTYAELLAWLDARGAR